jgi:hypothetical protein
VKKISCGSLSIRPTPYSPDIAPYDFVLFGHAKHCLSGIVFQSADELLDALASVISNIPMDTLYRVFEHWMERLEWVSQNNGDYYP